jgi:hypothetical protein
MDCSADPCSGNLIDVDSMMPLSSDLVQTEANYAEDSLMDLDNDWEPVGDLSPHDTLRLSSAAPAQEPTDSSSVIAGNESDTDEEGETPLSGQPNVSDKRRQQNAKFNSW